MPVHDLPARQLATLRYLDKNGPSRVRDITAALGRDRTEVQNALRLLRDKRLAAPRMTFPATWAITPEGQLVLAFADKAEGGQSR
jgi:MarR family